MSSNHLFDRKEIHSNNPRLSGFKTTIETAFYGNNVTEIKDVAAAYQLAFENSQTIVTDLPIDQPEKLGLPTDAKVLITNDGKIVGRSAIARKLILTTKEDKDFSALMREVVYHGQEKNFLKSSVVVGLHNDFMVKSHLMIPANFPMQLFQYLMNFEFSQNLTNIYEQSQEFPNENDLYFYADPDWQHPDYPDGLVILDPAHNCGAILGLRYFGELKKATLSLAWQIAHRNGFIACHGGMKQFQLPNSKYTMAAFGLSGTGKSTITLSHHGNKFPITVLHDDAFVINQKDGGTTALEPSYFDKTEDYAMDHAAIKYFLTAENVGITLDKNGQKVLVTGDIRNVNGRCIKSRFATKDRKDHINEKIDGVFWIMKDETLPPILKLNDPTLAAIFGVTLATKRSTAENIQVSDQLIIEPFANPFRTYPLAEDYQNFRTLFTNGTTCYILNTASFNERNISPEVTLKGIEDIVTKTGEFETFGPYPQIEYLNIDDYEPDFNNQKYRQALKTSLKTRLVFIEEKTLNPFTELPTEVTDLLTEMILKLEK